MTKQEAITYLTKRYQEDRFPLKADGDLGPLTHADIESLRLFEDIEDANMGRFFGMLQCLKLAAEYVGFGGDRNRNNRSEFIDSMRKMCGFPPRSGPWCAVFASWCSKGTFPDLELSRGARKLVRNVSKHGHDITKLALGTEADFIGLASYERGSGFQGHVRFVSRLSGRYLFIGGNEMGDLVRWGTQTKEDFVHRIIQVGTILDED